MARSDLLLTLARAAAENDTSLVRRTVEALAAEERAKHHHVLADRLAETLASRPQARGEGQSQVLRTLLYEGLARRRLDDLVLPPKVHEACLEVIEEQHRADLLRSYGLEPRHRVLLVGPPGNGKTSLAEALAEALALPYYTVRYEGLIGSFLGETAARLASVFDYVAARHCVVFFDEFDTLGKERGDIHETGEIKRVVSSLLMQIDRLPSYVVIVTATNHPELLDRAAWRRFQVRLDLPRPTKAAIVTWLRNFRSRAEVPFTFSLERIASALQGCSFSEVEQFAVDVLRRHVLALPASDLDQIIQARLKNVPPRVAMRPTKVSR